MTTRHDVDRVLKSVGYVHPTDTSNQRKSEYKTYNPDDTQVYKSSYVSTQGPMELTEKCPVCKEALQAYKHEMTVCPNGHVWNRDYKKSAVSDR